MTDWKTGVALPSEIVEEIDECVERDRYPLGKYHSRSHFVVEAIKEKLQKEKSCPTP